MAESVVLNSFSSLQNSSIVAALNDNNQTIEEAFADCVSLSGTTPNAMQSNLDMNSFQIINLPAPSTVDSPVRLVDVQSGSVSVTPNGNLDVTGDDIILVIGDSTMYTGYTLDTTIDISNSNVYQFPNQTAGSAPANKVSLAIEPLNYWGLPQANTIGPALAFARQLSLERPPRRRLVLVTQALTGSSIAGTDGVGQGVKQWAYSASALPAQMVTYCPGGGATSSGDVLSINGHTMTVGTQFAFSTNQSTLSTNFAGYVNPNSGTLGFTAQANTPSAGFTTLTLTTSGTIGNIAQAYNVSKVGAVYSFYYNADGLGNGYLVSALPGFFAGGVDAGGGNLFKTAVIQANRALANGANNRFLCILSSLGTNEEHLSASYLQTLYVNMVAAFRSQITGGTNVPFIALPMVPEFVAANQLWNQMDSVMRNTPNLIKYSSYVPSTLGSNNPDGTVFHPDSSTCRATGYNAVAGYHRALGNEGTNDAFSLSQYEVPSSPINGQMWFDGTNVKISVNGVTKTFTIV